MKKTAEDGRGAQSKGIASEKVRTLRWVEENQCKNRKGPRGNPKEEEAVTGHIAEKFPIR